MGHRSDSESKKQHWAWDIDSRIWKELDSIYLRNDSQSEWKEATLSIIPTKDDKKPVVRKFENVLPGETRWETDVCNFRRGGGTAELNVKARMPSKEQENKKERERILESCKQKIAALVQDRDRNIQKFNQARNDCRKERARIEELRKSELENLDKLCVEELKRYDFDIAAIRAKFADVEAEKQARLGVVEKEMDRIRSKTWRWIFGAWAVVSASCLFLFFGRMIRTYTKKEIPNAGRDKDRFSGILPKESLN